MEWQDQGRQYPMWFGHGTAPHFVAEPDDKPDATEVAYSAIGNLPPRDRKPFEGWLQDGGLGKLAPALSSWSADSSLSANDFRVRQFGARGDAGLAGQAQTVGTALDNAATGEPGRTDRAAAGAALASLVQTVRVEAFPHLIALSQRHAAQAAPRPAGRARPTTRPASRHGAQTRIQRVPQAVPTELNTEENVRELAKLLQTEAGGPNDRVAMATIAFTVLERMRRNDVTHVHDVWDRYHYGKDATPLSADVARQVLSGQAINLAPGATHYFSPNPALPDPAFSRVFPRVPTPEIPASRYRFFVRQEMARFARAVLAVFVALLLGMASEAAWGSQSAQCDHPYHRERHLIDFNRKPFPVWHGLCHDETCQALRDLQCVVDAMEQRDVPNTMAFPTRAESDIAMNAFLARIEAFGHEHPARIALYCSHLVRYARTATGNLKREGNLITDITELAVRLDRPDASCSSWVMAALPRTKAVQKAVDEARDYCWAERALCERIHLP